MTDYLSLLAKQKRAYSEPTLSGILRSVPEDFYVEEVLGFEPEGDGEHVFLWIEKRAANTQFVAEQLAKFAKVSPKYLSFSGMKDRWAVTRQWFSVHLPGKVAPNFSDLNGDEITVLKQTRHPRKLRRGVHKENLFRIRLRELQGDRNYLADRLDIITRQGVPNYFGEQRFGRGAKNLSSAQRWFAGAFKPRRNQQGFFLSAARSFLFNQILSLRVNDQSWLNYLPGDIMMLNGTHSVFKPALDEELSQRLTSGDVHATAAMYGKTSDMAVSDDCAQLEEAVFSAYPELCEGLIAQGLKAERRALRLVPQQLQCRWLDNENLELSFKLPSGCFATSVMAELLHYTNAEQRD